MRQRHPGFGQNHQLSKLVQGLSVLFLLCCIASGDLPAQTLAHKGWVGSGLTIDPWWRGAVFYQLDPAALQNQQGNSALPPAVLLQFVDYLKSLGVDAVVLSPSPRHVSGTATGTPADKPDQAQEEWEQLQQALSQRKMRLLVDLPLTSRQTDEQTVALARFWLSRGVAGMQLVAEPTAGTALDPASLTERMRLLRHLCAGYMGDRVLMGDANGDLAPSVEPQPISRRVARTGRNTRRIATATDQPQLRVDHALAMLTILNSKAMRDILSGSQVPGEVLISDRENSIRSSMRLSPGEDDSARLAVEKTVATLLLTGGGQPMILYGQEIGVASDASAQSLLLSSDGGDPAVSTSGIRPESESPGEASEEGYQMSLLNWYRKLIALREQEPALRSGSLTMLDTGYPDVVAWVRKASRLGERPVLVMCNLSGHSVLISVEQQLKQIGLKPTSGMVPLALSFTGINPSYTATGINLPASGVYLGAILQPGLEDAPAPYVSHRRGR